MNAKTIRREFQDRVCRWSRRSKQVVRRNGPQKADETLHCQSLHSHLTAWSFESASWHCSLSSFAFLTPTVEKTPSVFSIRSLYSAVPRALLFSGARRDVHADEPVVLGKCVHKDSGLIIARYLGAETLGVYAVLS